MNTLDALLSSWKSKIEYGRLVGLGATHAHADRSIFECERGVSFCRRCGALIEWDSRPDLITAKKVCLGPRSWSWPVVGLP